MTQSRPRLGLPVAGLVLMLALPAPAPTLAQDFLGADELGPIAALSDAEIAALGSGEGMGLARAAELNGYPGPRHVLDLAEELDLSESQRARVQSIFEATQAEARRIGRAYLEAEAALDAAFASRRADPATVMQRIEQAAGLRAELRAIHLLAHMQTAPVLNADQVDAYASLRGRDEADGAAEAPEHHGEGDVEH